MAFDDFFRAQRRFVAGVELFPLSSAALVPIALCHLAAVVLMAATEVAVVPKAIFVLTWGFLNFFWLTVLRRPALAAALSLMMIIVLILLSRLKHDVLLLTVNFVDLMIVDTDTFAFLLTIFPNVRQLTLLALVVVMPVLVLLWRFDPFRIRVRSAAAGAIVCLASIAGMSMAFPSEPWEGFFGDSYVSKFSRSGVDAVSEFLQHGFLDSDRTVTERLKTTAGETCRPGDERPHIIMVFDESSFDITAAPGIKVPPDYQRHFRSFDGKIRSFVVEGAGGPSWYTEYNVLTGLSARSYGRFAYFVTRIAPGRVDRGLPQALRRCGYHTYSLYPTWGAFLGARSFHTSTGVERFLDAKDLGTRQVEPDRFFYDNAVRLIERNRSKDPLFIFIYLAANHFPWDVRYRPDLIRDWQDLGNPPKVEEYLRRQTMSVRDYDQFIARLKREFASEHFLLVRFGDHQPDFAKEILEPSLDETAIGQRLMSYDPRYYTTYYAIDAVNFRPVDMSSARDTLEAPYLPLVVQEAAGLPLDPSFIEQKKILERCNGVFYMCGGGAEARRFNRLLINAGLIKGL